ncbi:ATP-binding cassette domain-containing protein, partial [Klebsiella pneumoniae]
MNKPTVILQYEGNGIHHGPLRITAQTGQIVQIWGASGSGKSTLLSRIWGSRSLGTAHLCIRTHDQQFTPSTMTPAHFAFLRSRLMSYVGQHPTVLPREKLVDWFALVPTKTVLDGLRL